MRYWCAWVGLAFSLFAKCALAQDCANAAHRLATYQQSHACTTNAAYGCLAPAERASAPPIYFWKNGAENWKTFDGQTVQHYQPHFLLTYLRHLRDVYTACGPSSQDVALAQTEAVITQARTTSAPGETPVLAWENRYGYAQGMEQAEMSAYAASLAAAYQKHGERDKAMHLMRLSLQMLESLSKPVGIHSGGVRSVVAEPCGNDTVRIPSCFWFHSRGLSIDTANEEHVATVLNQHLHVIYDVLLLYKTIHDGGVPIPPEYGTRAKLLTRLESYAAGGLGQLAFARGNSLSFPDAPPNMAQFLNRQQSGAQHYYLAFYRFDIDAHRGKNIRWKSVCHYHTHVLAKLAHIKTLLDKHPEVFRSTPSGQGQFLYSTVESLFYGAGEPMGAMPTKALVWQLWQAHRVKHALANCPVCDGAACSSEEDYVNTYYGTLKWIH
jgi:hypothetical protein